MKRKMSDDELEESDMLGEIVDSLHRCGSNCTDFAQTVDTSPSGSAAWSSVIASLGGVETRAAQLVASYIIASTPVPLQPEMSSLLAVGSPSLQKPPKQQKCVWTDYENAALCCLLQTLATPEKRSWKDIAQALGTDKTGPQCSQHWARVANPSIHKGAWGATEEALLLRLHGVHGPLCWATIAAGIKHRNDAQCRYQCRRALASRRVAWSSAEDVALRDIILGFGGLSICEQSDWINVSQLLARQHVHSVIPRTALECKERSLTLPIN